MRSYINNETKRKNQKGKQLFWGILALGMLLCAGCGQETDELPYVQGTEEEMDDTEYYVWLEELTGIPFTTSSGEGEISAEEPFILVIDGVEVTFPTTLEKLRAAGWYVEDGADTWEEFSGLVVDAGSSGDPLTADGSPVLLDYGKISGVSVRYANESDTAVPLSESAITGLKFAAAGSEESTQSYPAGEICLQAEAGTISIGISTLAEVEMVCTSMETAYGAGYQNDSYYGDTQYLQFTYDEDGILSGLVIENYE